MKTMFIRKSNANQVYFSSLLCKAISQNNGGAPLPGYYAVHEIDGAVHFTPLNKWRKGCAVASPISVNCAIVGGYLANNRISLPREVRQLFDFNRRYENIMFEKGGSFYVYVL
nr:MAG TPA: hypothetical protein [Bacteriophage sp.]